MIDPRSIPEQTLSMAAELQQLFAVERDRRQRKLGALLKGGSRENVVLVMMANSGFIELFNNWVRSCDLHNLEVRTWSVFFAVDEGAAENAEQQGFRTYFDPISYGDQPGDAVKEFGDADFRRLMFQKTAIVQDVLELGYDVLFQDVDMVWMKDPMARLLNEEGQEFDARFMFDGPNAWHAPLHANTGFFLLRNRSICRRFWNQVLNRYVDMLHRGGQQTVVNSILGEFPLCVDILPEEHFANGHLFSIDQPSRLPADPSVIHCSWTNNREHKLLKYKQEGLWYL